MKKFVLHLVKFIFVLILFGHFVNLFVTPYHGNPDFNEKLQYFELHSDEFNNVVIGSSRLYRHLDPQVLDNVSGQLKLKTFNMAAPATYNPETYYLYENFLNEEHPTIKYAMIELQQLNEIPNENLLTTRSYYWHNMKFLKFSIAYIADSDKPTKDKLILQGKYFLSLLINLLNPFKYKFDFERDESVLGENKNGYFPLDDQPNQTKRYESFKKDTTILQSRIEAVQKSFELKSHRQFLNKTHLKKLLELIELSSKKGIKLYLIIPPKLTAYNELLALKEALPSDNVIEIANYQNYSALYRAKNAFDIGHLNESGSKLFSRYLAEKLLTQR